MGIWEINAGELILAGGPIMIPIILCSVVAVAIVIGKLLYLSSIKTDTHKLKTDVFDMVRNNQVKEAVRLCDENPSPVAKVIKAGVLKMGADRETVREAMEDMSLFEIPKLEKRFSALSTIANVTPLLGLLGTVAGMTVSFHTIQVRATSMSPVTPGDLAGGIWEALLTTVAGLIVAIPTFVAYNYLVSRVNYIVLEMERAATELLNFLCNFAETTEISQ